VFAHAAEAEARAGPGERGRLSRGGVADIDAQVAVVLAQADVDGGSRR
jgi:hypothetical protein